LALLLLLAGCGQGKSPAGALAGNAGNENATSSRPGQRVTLGHVELPVGPDVLSSGLSGQGLAPDSSYQFTRVLVPYRSYDDPSTQRRYGSMTYEIKNLSSSDLNNFTLYAANNPPSDIGGTAYHSVTDVNNASITDPAVIRTLRPENGLPVNATSLQTDPMYADLQAFTPAEAGTILNAAKTAGVAGASETVLEYGWVARIEGGTSHVIPPNGLGQVTIAYSFPISSNIKNTRLSFEVALDAPVRITRGYGETTASAVNRAQAAGASQVALIGTDTDTAAGYTTLRLKYPKLYVGQDQPSLTLGSDGGQLKLGDATVTVPKGTVGSDTSFDLTTSASPPMTIPAPYTVVNTYNVSAAQPVDGLPLTVRLPHPAQDPT